MEMVERVKKIIESIESIGVECREEYNNEVCGLNGYYYSCFSRGKEFTLIVDSSGDVYIRTPYFSKADQVLSNLSQLFNINIDKLKFSELGFFCVFKLEPLPEELINLNLTTDNDEIALSTIKNDMILIDIIGKISLLYDKETKKFIILSIKNWEIYKKIRDFIDQDVRDVLDKLSLSKPEFAIKAYGEELGLEGKGKENLKKILNKLMPVIDKLMPVIERFNKITTDGTEVSLNNIVLELKDENWGADILPIIEKMSRLNVPVSIELHKNDFWFIKVHYDYLLKVARILNILNIDPMQTIHDINPKKESLLFYEPRDYYIFDSCGGDYYHIVPSKNVQKYLQLLLGVNVTQSADSFEIDNGYKYIVIKGYKYIVIKGHEDEIHIGVYEENKLLTSLRTYLWYFDVRDFNGLKNLSKEKVADIINRQIEERYFYPMPFNQVKQYVEKFVDTTIKVIDKTIGYVRDKVPDFTSPIKDIAEINCIFDKHCNVALELDKQQRLSSYHSLISTNEGHMPVPIFLEYAGLSGRYSDDDDISVVKNMLYFIRGYDEAIVEYERDYSSIGDDVRGAVSELFQKAVVLYNKLLQNKNNLSHREGDEDYEEYECPQYTLPDGIGYCRSFNYEELMQKTEDELANDIIESLTEIRVKMTIIREKMLKSDSFPVTGTW